MVWTKISFYKNNWLLKDSKTFVVFIEIILFFKIKEDNVKTIKDIYNIIHIFYSTDRNINTKILF